MSATATSTTSARTWTRYAPRRPGQGGGFLKWNDVTVGYELEGKWLGPQEGTYGPYGAVEREDDQVVKFSLPAVLRDRLDSLPAGALLKIVYLGMGGSGERRFHQFDVFIDLATVPDMASAGVDDEVPF